MVTTFIEKQQKQLLKKFHVLLGKVCGGQDRKEAILQSYGVESSRDLSVNELSEICDMLTKEANPKMKEIDTWRKRVIAAISAYHKTREVDIFQKNNEECTTYEKEQRIRYVKGTAKKASGGKDFNEIPLGQLQEIYSGFIKKRKYANMVDRMVDDRLLKNISLN